MRKYFRILLLTVVVLSSILIGTPSGAMGAEFDNRPIVIVSADKLDSLELFHSDLAAIKQLLAGSACGLMNIRTGAGYCDSASGYLTLGAGSRSTMPGVLGGTFEPRRHLPGGKAKFYLDWSFGATVPALEKGNLVVPEIGWINNQACTEDRQVDPGQLGAIFRDNGWRTCLIGNLDNITTSNRPGGLLLMDRHGIIDEGNIGNSMNEFDFEFPYRYRFSISKAIRELDARLAAAKIIELEFGDFFRLDLYRDKIDPAQYLILKQNCWARFNGFLAELDKLRTAKPFTLVVVSPSVSKESRINKNLLAPVIISSPEFPPGLLSSGTTKWPGLVANIDLLPTLLKLSNLQTNYRLPGRFFTVKPVSDYLSRLEALNQRLAIKNSSQRRILNWYMGIISVGWIAGLLLIYMARLWFRDGMTRNLSLFYEWLITGVVVIPLSLVILPIFPAWLWEVGEFLILTSLLGAFLVSIKTIDLRMLILSGLIWGGLILDQILGWHLIRFSALGYSAMAGSRYYGLGNEFMGVFLAASLIFGHLLNQYRAPKWLIPLVLGFSIFVLSWPQLGAKFGGILSGTAGFSYYLIRFYKVKLDNLKLWVILSGCLLILAAIGWWDSLRPPEVQTHIGRFIHLFLAKDFQQMSEIIFRKLLMNLKLTIVSPWVRIILLSLALGIVNRLVTGRNLASSQDALIWKSILVTGIAAYLVNDAGVLAFATCLAYGFSFMLLKLREILYRRSS